MSIETDIDSGGITDARLAAYLKPETKIEPLVFHWLAWTHLLAPATHAMNVAFRHLPKLRSFIANPAVHLAATKDPAMLGGPFLALQQSDMASVHAVLEDTVNRCAEQIAFAKAFRELDERLLSTASGYSLDEFSRKLPDVLAGRVELVYDLNHHPRIKVMEELLYDSPIDSDHGHQICLHEALDSDRAFFMGAPMVDSSARLFRRLRFDSALIDELSSMRVHAGSVLKLASALSIHGPDLPLFERFFTHAPPIRQKPKYDGDDVRLRYFGHACVLIQTKDVAVLLDPLTAWQRDAVEANLTFDDLPDFIDHVVITHAHQDHFVPEVLLQLRQRIGRISVPCNDRGNLADPSLKLILKKMGFKNICALQPFENIEIPGGWILSLPFVGEHGGLDINSKQCVAVKVRERTFLFLVDTDGIEPALSKSIASRVGKIDAVFLGMECRGAPMSWLYGPLLTRATSKRNDESRRLSGADCDQAWSMIQHLECLAVFIYAMGQEPWLKNLMGLAYTSESTQIVESDKLVERCRAQAISARRLYGCCEMIF